jgi:small redox-active disulfide protein 2
MKKIEVLGPGCNNCQRLEANAREAVALTGVEAEIIKVTDYGIMSTPGLVIDGTVVSYGRIPSPGDIAAWLSK